MIQSTAAALQCQVNCDYEWQGRWDRAPKVERSRRVKSPHSGHAAEQPSEGHGVPKFSKFNIPIVAQPLDGHHLLPAANGS